MHAFSPYPPHSVVVLSPLSFEPPAKTNQPNVTKQKNTERQTNKNSGGRKPKTNLKNSGIDTLHSAAEVEISFEDVGNWYNTGGFEIIPWLELLDLRKWCVVRFLYVLTLFLALALVLFLCHRAVDVAASVALALAGSVTHHVLLPLFVLCKHTCV